MVTTPILILGSNSFSGAGLINKLLIQGYSVVGVSRSNEVDIPFRIYFDNPNLRNFKFFKININTDSLKVAHLIRDYKIKYIFNFMAQSMVAQSWQNPENWYQTNLVGLTKLCSLLTKENSIKKFIHFTTPEVYGSTSGWQRESFNFLPSTPYAVSRAASDWHLMCLSNEFNFPIIFTRAANVYGPGQQLYRLIPRAVLSILRKDKFPLQGKGDSLRSFIHIEDISSALTAIMHEANPGSSYHLSTLELISIKDLLQIIADKMKIELYDFIEPISERPGKDFAYKLNSDKIRDDLGWIDKISLDKGLDDVISWSKANFVNLRKMSLDYTHKE